MEQQFLAEVMADKYNEKYGRSDAQFIKEHWYNLPYEDLRSNIGQAWTCKCVKNGLKWDQIYPMIRQCNWMRLLPPANVFKHIK